MEVIKYLGTIKKKTISIVENKKTISFLSKLKVEIMREQRARVLRYEQKNIICDLDNVIPITKTSLKVWLHFLST